jgi:tetratricopeptide (TPR) repeat protein
MKRNTKQTKIDTKQTKINGTNENNGRSAGFQHAWLPGMEHNRDKHAGSQRTGRYFRLFRLFSFVSCLFSFVSCFSSFLILTSFAPAQPRPASVSGEISGQLRYAAGGAPADKVLVRLETFGGGTIGQILTDRTGKFQFRGLMPAIYVITAHATGYIEVRQQIDLKTSPREYLLLQLVAEKSGETKSSTTTMLLDATIPAEAQKEFDQGRKLILDEKKIDDGISHLEKAVSLHPKFLEAQMLLGTAYLDNRKYEKAEQVLRRAIEINPKTATVYFALGETYRKQKKYDEAEKILVEGLTLEPKSYQGHFSLGQVYFARGEIAKAGPQVGQALQLKPDFAEAYLLAGNLFLKARQAEKALQMFEEYLRLEPNGQYSAETRELVAKIRKITK